MMVGIVPVVVAVAKHLRHLVGESGNAGSLSPRRMVCVIGVTTAPTSRIGILCIKFDESRIEVGERVPSSYVRLWVPWKPITVHHGRNVVIGRNRLVLQVVLVAVQGRGTDWISRGLIIL